MQFFIISIIPENIMRKYFILPAAVVAFCSGVKAQNHSAIKVMPKGYKITPVHSPNLFDTTAGIKKSGNRAKLAILKQDGMPCVIPLTINTIPTAGQNIQRDKTIPNAWLKDSLNKKR